MMSMLGFSESMKMVFYYENNGRSFEYEVSNLNLNQTVEFPKNILVKITTLDFNSQLSDKSGFINHFNNPYLKIYSKNNLFNEIPVESTDMFLDENGVFTIDFSLTEKIKLELIDFFKTINNPTPNVEEFIVFDVNPSKINPEYLHIDMMLKRKTQINPTYP